MTFTHVTIRVLVGVLSLPLTVCVCFLQAGTHVAMMVTLACFVFLRALYTAHFGLMNRVSDATILRIIQLVSVATSVIVHAIEIGYKVHNCT